MKIISFDDPVLKNEKISRLIRRGLVQFVNCQILRGKSFLNESFWVENGRIVNPEPILYVEKRSPDLKIDCLGNFIAPGFIDIQINGAFGADFSTDASKISENIEKVARRLVQFGVTSFCPTIVSSSPSFYKKVIDRLKIYVQDENSTIFLGLHLEGPFINKEKKGAHADQHFMDGFKCGFDDLISVYGSDLSRVSLITLAPELQNSLEVIEKLVSMGVKVSLGHSIASLSEGENAVNAGASCITHLFNAMLPFHHRDPGLVGLLASANIDSHRTLFFGVISDGIHTHDAALRIAHRVHPEGLILVTDAVALLGLDEGTHRLGDMSITIEGKRAIVSGTETLTGSISPMDYCIRHFLKASQCDPTEALRCASLHPAQCLGIDSKKGSLDFGLDADFLILSENFYVLSTYIGGRLVWVKN